MSTQNKKDCSWKHNRRANGRRAPPCTNTRKLSNILETVAWRIQSIFQYLFIWWEFHLHFGFFLGFSGFRFQVKQIYDFGLYLPPSLLRPVPSLPLKWAITIAIIAVVVEVAWATRAETEWVLFWHIRFRCLIWARVFMFQVQCSSPAPLPSHPIWPRQNWTLFCPIEMPDDRFEAIWITYCLKLPPC